MLQLKWIKCKTDVWCSFDNLNLTTVTEQGVYVIWHEGNPGQVVYVGQGDVTARIADHRGNRDITQHAGKGTLRVTWASVPAAQRDGVERFLADKWLPLAGDVHPFAVPIAVNSPW